MKTYSLLFLFVVVMAGCNSPTEEAQKAVDAFYRNAKAPVKAKLTIGKWSNTMELSTDDFRK